MALTAPAHRDRLEAESTTDPPSAQAEEMRFCMKSILIVVVLIVVFVLAIRFIANHGGWQGGCNGNCASCGSHCSEEQKKKKQ